MASLQTIKDITFRSRTEGFDETTAKLKQMAGAHDGVAVASERTTKATLDVGRAIDNIQKHYDAAYRNQSRMSRDLATLDRGLSQGRLSFSRHAELVSMVSSKYGEAVIANDNMASSYGRLSASLTRLSPLLSNMGMGASVGLVGGGAFAGIAGAIAAVTAAGAGIANAGDQWTTYENRLRAAGEASGMLGQRTKEMADLAIRTRTDMGSTVELYSGLRKATEDLGKSQTEVARVTETINKAFVLGGQSASTASGAILQLNQAFASGTLRGDELNSVLEGAPPLARLIAREFGIGVGELRKYAEEGKLTADRVFGAIAAGSAEIDQAFGKSATTMAQASANAGTAFTQLGAEMDRIFGISERLIRIFGGVADAARGMAGSVSAWGDNRQVESMKSALEAISVYERQVQELQGRRDYASQKDLAAATEQLAKYRNEWESLTSKRIDSMIQLPEPIKLNAEGMVTYERTVKDLTKATDDLAASEKKLSLETMSPLAKATQEANNAHQERLKLYEQLRTAGAEQARINEMIARSEKLRVQTIAEATEDAQKKAARSTRSTRRDPSMRGLNTDFAGSLQALMEAVPGITINSGFRSVERQAQLWEEALRKYGSASAARRWVAPPGRSKHNAGFAADLGFATPAARQEAHRRAGEFGLTFPMGHEPWHVESKGARLETQIKQQTDWSDAIEEANRSLDMQRAALGLSVGEMARLQKVQDLTNVAMRSGIPLTDAMKEQIAAMGQRAAETATYGEKMQESLRFDQEFASLGKDVLGGFISDLRQGKDAADAFGNALDGIADRVLDMALNSIFDPKGGGGIGSFFSGLLRSGGGTISHNIDPLTGQGYHTGGLVGSDPTFTRYIHPAYFENAPRYHGGLRPGEVPAILQQGEWVLSRDDVAAIKGGGAGGSAAPSSPPVVINNYADGTKVEARQERQPDGSTQTVLDIIDERARSAVRRDVRQNRSLAKELGTGFNGRG